MIRKILTSMEPGVFRQSSPKGTIGKTITERYAGRPSFGIRIRAVLSCLALFVSSAALGQVSYNASGPTAGNLLRTIADNSSTGATEVHSYNTGGTGNTWSSAITIPFTFNFYGTPYTQVVVSKNGLLSFTTSLAGTTVNTALNTNTALPNTSLPNNMIAWYWGDFSTSLGTNDDIWTSIEGTAPNRQFWIRSFSLELDDYSFTYNAVVLEETTNKIYIVDGYNSTSSTATLTVGVQQNSTTAVQVAGSPNLTVVNTGTAASDNDYYTFEPFTLSANEVGVSDIISPANSCSLTGAETVTIEVTNYGTTAQSNIPVSFSISGPVNTATVTGTVTGPIAPGASANFTFATTANLSGVGMYQVTASTLLTGDANPANDEITESVASFNVLNGIYTINSAAITGGTNFTSFTDAVTALSTCGVSGPVIFNVTPGSGPYTEQVVIPQITGASASNRITFNGNGQVLTFGSVNNDARATLKFDGADFITIDSLIINANTGDYGWGIHFTNAANNNEIINSVINSSTSINTSDFAGIVASGSNTSATTGGVAADNTLISGNTITGGYYGISMAGDGTTGMAFNNQITGNTITDFYYYGIYLDDVESFTVTDNDISRPTRSGAGIFYGIRMGGTASEGNLFEGNRVHNSHGGNLSSTSTTYGIYITGADAPATAPNQYINNLIYNMNGQGTLYGFYNSSSNNARYFHNTVSLDNAASSTNDITRGFYQTTTASGIEFKNNIVSVTRGGTGTNYALYFNTSGSTIDSDNNVLYVAGTTSHIGYSGSAQTSLAAWQATGNDANSTDADPDFNSPATGDFTPTNYLVNDIGAPVGVTLDINNNTRSAVTPDPGAYEFTAACQPPVLAITPAFNLCEGSMATLGVTGANTYTWNNNMTGDNITVSPTSTTTYTVIGYIGTCSDTATVTVTVNAVPTATVATTDALCNGTATGTATVTATGGFAPYTYAWSPFGGTSVTADSLTAGNYTATITDDNGCIATVSAVINEPGLLTATATGTNALCTGSATGTATVTATGGTGTYTYTWDTTPAQTTATATNLTTGTYLVTVTDANNCSTTASVFIDEPATALAITTTQENVLCAGGANGAASVSATGGTGAYSYNWNTFPAQTNDTITGLTAGNYVVTVTDANGCTATETVTITQPDPVVATATSGSVSCNGDADGTSTVTVNGGVAPYTYVWNTTPAQTTQTATNLAPGTYTVTVTGNNGCTTTATTTITEPAVLTATTSSTDITCFGGLNGTGTVTATGGTAPYTYAWATFPTQTSATANGLGMGNYNVTVTDANGCSLSDSVTIAQPAEIVATITASTISCSGTANGTATVTATGGTGNLTYLWNTTPAQTSATATGLAAGTYEVVITDQNGCQKTAFATITGVSAPAAGFSFSNTGLDYTFTNTTTNAATYVWDFGDGSATDTTTNPVHTYATAGTYTVTLTATNQCGTNVSTQIISIVSTAADALTSSISIWPNPASNYVNLTLENVPAQETYLRIYSIEGRLVTEEKLTLQGGTYHKEISTAHFSKGVYVVQIMAGNKVQTQRLVIQ